MASEAERAPMLLGPRRELGFVPPDLRKLDELECELLALPLFADLRPMRGAAGLVDWRLAGFLSRLTIRGRVDGEGGELTLLPAAGRLAVDKVLLVGIGESTAFDGDRFDEATTRILETLTHARIRTAAIELPGRSIGAIDPAEAMERFLRIARAYGEEIDELVLIEGPMAQRAMEPVVERERRRSRARRI